MRQPIDPRFRILQEQVARLYGFKSQQQEMRQPIDQRLHISEGTSKSQLARARRILQEQVARLYGFKSQQQEG